jgi:hypothetical protein
VFDKVTGLFEGVPSVQDVGEHYVTVRALGQQPHDWAKDVFSIEVTEKSRTDLSNGAVPLAGQHHKVTGHIQVKVTYESLKVNLFTLQLIVIVL